MTAKVSTISHVTPEAPPSAVILKRGSTFNARVSLISTPAGLQVLKDFSFTPFYVRHTAGRILIRHELAVLSRLQGLSGVPTAPIRLHALALSYRYVAGETLATVLVRSTPVDQAFFLALEQLVASLHARGFVHLDLRNGKNILRTAEGQPSLLDFQTALSVRWIPAWLRRPLQAVDLSGVYKWWARLAPGQMSPQRVERLRAANRWRMFWRFNYPQDDHRLRR